MTAYKRPLRHLLKDRVHELLIENRRLTTELEDADAALEIYSLSCEIKEKHINDARESFLRANWKANFRLDQLMQVRKNLDDLIEITDRLICYDQDHPEEAYLMDRWNEIRCRITEEELNEEDQAEVVGGGPSEGQRHVRVKGPCFT
jgi:hypothetical protein